MLIEVTHSTTFSYTNEVSESVMEARLEPRNDADQRRVRFELALQPAARIFSYTDGFGNVAHCFSLMPAHRALTLAARSRVETLMSNPFAVPASPAPAPDAVEAWHYLQLGGPVCMADEVCALADRFQLARFSDPFEALQGLMRHINDTFEYQPEVTTVTSTVADLLKVRKGVCQDFAHLMIAVCRVMAIPARYVSGYIVTEPSRQPRGGGASHAWCEVYMPGIGWRGFDPTNAVLAAEYHVKVGVGRDYHDVPPTRGVYRGLAEEQIAVTVEARRLERQG